MSESIYICAGSLCCTLVICSILRIISPSGSTQKIMTLVVSIFSLCCLASPFYELARNINVNNIQSDAHSIITEKYASEFDSEVFEVTAEYINEYISSLLKSCSVKNPRIETVLSSDDSRGIYIKEMNIYLYGSENVNLNEIRDLVYSAVGVKPNITESKYG